MNQVVKLVVIHYGALTVNETATLVDIANKYCNFQQCHQTRTPADLDKYDVIDIDLEKYFSWFSDYYKIIKSSDTTKIILVRNGKVSKEQEDIIKKWNCVDSIINEIPAYHKDRLDLLQKILSPSLENIEEPKCWDIFKQYFAEKFGCK